MNKLKKGPNNLKLKLLDTKEKVYELIEISSQTPAKLLSLCHHLSCENSFVPTQMCEHAIHQYGHKTLRKILWSCLQ